MNNPQYIRREMMEISLAIYPSLSPIYENESVLKIYHSCDLKNLLQVVNTDKLINNSLS